MTDSPSLQRIQIRDLAQFTSEKTLPTSASADFLLMFTGRDDVHEALKYVLSGVRQSLYINQYGYDDDELNEIIWGKVMDPTILTMITLDKSQAGGRHEKRLLDADKARDLKAFNTHFAIGQSATRQISHTKGLCADGVIGAEGSTNWSISGEGEFVVKGQPGGTGYKAQNNTQSFFLCPFTVQRFQTELISEHMIALKQMQDASR